MSEQARQELCELLGSYGPNICDTPRMCEMMLQQHRAAHPEATDALIGVLRLGRVKTLLDVTAEQQEALADEAARSQGISPEMARWAVETWSEALRQGATGGTAFSPQAAHAGTPPAFRLPATMEAPTYGGGMYRRAILHMGVVALAGAFGAALPGVQIAILIEHDVSGVFGEFTKKMVAGESPVQFALLYGGIGLIAGAMGGAAGWMVGGSQSLSYLIHGGSTLGQLGCAAAGAFLVSRFTALIGLLLLGTLGVFVGGALGAALGAFLGYVFSYLIFFLLLCCVCN